MENNSIFTQAAKFLRERRDSRRWKAVVFCLAIMVICTTVWVLSKKGQALTHEEDVLACPLVIHEHEADCLDENGNLICKKADYVFHMHNSDCYNANNELVCQLPEVEVHEHSKDCFESEKILICGYEEDEASPEEGAMSLSDEEANTPMTVNQVLSVGEAAELICQKEEHIHNDSCYEGVEKTLICNIEEGGHTHGDDCYEEEIKKVLTCGMEENAHTHNDSCYEQKTEKILTCEDDSEEHTHDDSCYEEKTEKKLTCDKEEGGHTHDDSCYEEQAEKKLICTEEEGGHTHNDTCYSEEGEKILVCDKEEHQHDESCYALKNTDEVIPEETKESETNQEETREDDTAKEESKENESHIHSEDCYKTVQKLVCGKKGVHIHEDYCYDNGILICEAPYIESVEEHVHGSKCFETDKDKEYTKSFENDDIIVTAVYKKSAQIPEEAQLRLEQITKESDPNHYEQRFEELGEENTLKMLFQVGFYTDDERYMPKDTVQFTIRFLNDKIYADSETVTVAYFAEDGVKLISDTDNERAITFEVQELSDLAFVTAREDNKAHILTYEGEDYIMTVTLGAGTQIQEDARLTVDQITKENNPVHYEQRLADLEGEEIAKLLRIWVSVDDMDTPLKEKASVKVQFLDDKIYAQNDTVKVACFDGDSIKIISGTDIDEEHSTTIEVEELSELAFITTEEENSDHVLTYEGEDYMVTVRLAEDTKIPEEAQLMVDQITRESNQTHYEQRLAELGEAEGMLKEEEGIALLLHMWISVDGEEIALDENADVTVQFLGNALYFEGDTVKAAHFGMDGVKLLAASNIDEKRATTFEVSELNEFAFIAEDVRIMTCEGEDFIVTVRFRDTAGIPENAELIAERITKESDPESFAECKNEMQEQVEEKYVIMDALMEIGFYVNGEEIEPQDTVEVKIQLLDGENLTSEEDGSRKVVHFAEDGVEILEDADIFEDEGNSLSTMFQTDSFSLFAVARATNEITDAQMFHEAMESAEDGDVITIGADIEFKREQYNAETGDFEVPYTGWHKGDRGNLIIAKLTTGDEAGLGAPAKSVTLDLNGYTLKLSGDNMTLVDICWNAALTVIDSKESGSYSTTYDITVSRAIDDSGKTTETTDKRTITGGAIVGTGGSTAAWNGTDYVYDNGNRAAVFTMWYGTLTIKSGIIADNGNRAIQAKAGNINLEGGYLLHNSARDLYKKDANGNYNFEGGWYGDYGMAVGGAVMCERAYEDKAGTPGTLRLSGTILSGNKAVEGGAINVTEYKTYINNGFVTHNASYFGRWGDGGGGIRVHGGTFTMEGGQITANSTRGGGGGICISRNGDFQLIGGYITANSTTTDANGEGGGVALYGENVTDMDTNKSEWAHPVMVIGPDPEKGASQTSLYITNNHSDTDIDWGGGGMFVAENATAYLYNTLITGNSAKGFGGGVAGCATGRILDNHISGAAIYGNSASGAAYAGNTSTKHEDKELTDVNNNKAFWERGKDGKYLFQDYFSAWYSCLDEEMLGGGSENWDGSIDGKRLRELEKGPNNEWISSYVAGLNAYPTTDDINRAKKTASVFINGNTSATHGGGIMCNGILAIGKIPIEISSAMKVEAKKRLVDENKQEISMKDGQFSFTLYEASGLDAEPDTWKKVATGTNDAEGKIVFDKFLTFQKEGIYLYYAKEDDVSVDAANIGIKTDPALYAMWVEVVKNHYEASDANPDRDIYDVRRIYVYINESGKWEKINEKLIPNIQDGNVTNADDLESGVSDSNWKIIHKDNTAHDKDRYHNETHAITIIFTDEAMEKGETALGYTFTNQKSGVTQITVYKKWSDDAIPDNVTSVTVQLVKVKQADTDEKEESIDNPVKLNADNDWTYTWIGLDELSDGERYEVKEVCVNDSEEFVDAYAAEYVYTKDKDGNPVVTITNTPRTYDFELTKVNENSSFLSGAKFHLFSENDEKTALKFRQVIDGYEYVRDDESEGRVSSDLFTVENGKLIVSGLPAGTYILREIEAPIGYKIAVDHTITLGESTVVECKNGEDHKVEETSGNKYTLQFTLTDKEDQYELPETGGFGTDYINILGVIVMFGIIALIYITYRRKRAEGGR